MEKLNVAKSRPAGENGKGPKSKADIIGEALPALEHEIRAASLRPRLYPPAAGPMTDEEASTVLDRFILWAIRSRATLQHHRAPAGERQRLHDRIRAVATVLAGFPAEKDGSGSVEASHCRHMIMDYAEQRALSEDPVEHVEADVIREAQRISHAHGVQLVRDATPGGPRLLRRALEEYRGAHSSKPRQRHARYYMRCALEGERPLDSGTKPHDQSKKTEFANATRAASQTFSDWQKQHPRKK